jgi:hypothetical protein
MNNHTHQLNQVVIYHRNCNYKWLSAARKDQEGYHQIISRFITVSSLNRGPASLIHVCSHPLLLFKRMQ